MMIYNSYIKKLLHISYQNKPTIIFVDLNSMLSFESYDIFAIKC